jgi:hypothetical protein
MRQFMIIAFTLLLLTGCAGNRVMYNAEAEGAFFDSRGSDNFSYFVYEGPGSRTVAYLALDKRYTLQTQFWSKTAMNKALWNETYRDMGYKGFENYQARSIVATSGEILGYLITRYYYVTAWFVDDTKTTVVVPPPQRSPQQGSPLNRWNRDFDD